MIRPLEHAQRDRHAAVGRLLDLLSIPSVSARRDHAEHVAEAASWLAERLRAIGCSTVRIDQTPGHPVVYGERLSEPGRPTVLLYGHYDVQPPEPLDLWRTPPFQPTIIDDVIYARGAADDKGQLAAQLEALAAWDALGGPPTNVKIVLEGEEEIGSPNLGAWLREHAGEVRADVAVISDSAMIGREHPSIVYGLRGLAYVEIEVRGPNQDLHSGLYGGAVRNPAMALAHILVSLQDETGRILIPGFYDDVRLLDSDERAALAAVPFDIASFNAATGDAGGWGESGYSLTERIGARPALDINGISSGWTGEGAKTVLPATATAKVSMRLVPDQDHEKITELIANHVSRVTPVGTTATVHALTGGAPALCPRDNPGMRAAAAAYEVGFGKAPHFTRGGGSIPVVADLQTVLGMPTVLMGFGLPDDNLHAPNEKFELQQFYRGTATAVAFHSLLADQAHDV